MSNGVQIYIGGGGMAVKGDIEIKINFRDGEGSPARVFDIAAGIIRSFEALDRALIESVDSRISTDLILEDVEKSSLRVFLKNALKSTDDDALKSLDWKKLVGSYLVKAKYIAIEWLDKEPKSARIEDLTEKLRALASETNVRQLPDYAPISPTKLAQSLDEFQRVKKKFVDRETLIITLGQDEYTVDVKNDWLPSEYVVEATRAQDLSNDLEMVVTIKKPDMLGKSKWQFKHGKINLNAAITDDEWLEEFHDGKHPVVPGDALRVRARYDSEYDDKGELIKQEITIIKVYGKVSVPLQKDIFD